MKQRGRFLLCALTACGIGFCTVGAATAAAEQCKASADTYTAGGERKSEWAEDANWSADLPPLSGYACIGSGIGVQVYHDINAGRSTLSGLDDEDAAGLAVFSSAIELASERSLITNLELRGPGAWGDEGEVEVGARNTLELAGTGTTLEGDFAGPGTVEIGPRQVVDLGGYLADGLQLVNLGGTLDFGANEVQLSGAGPGKPGRIRNGNGKVASKIEVPGNYVTSAIETGGSEGYLEGELINEKKSELVLAKGAFLYFASSVDDAKTFVNRGKVSLSSGSRLKLNHFTSEGTFDIGTGVVEAYAYNPENKLVTDVEVDGSGAGEHGEITIDSGAATLAGKLKVKTASKFKPAIGETFTIVTAKIFNGSLSGTYTFGKAEGACLKQDGSGVGYVEEQVGNDLELRVAKELAECTK